ncbi:MAG: BsuPI-related putative proteinase inhibitor [Candidatus Eisenbacteria bacterium]|nr:BsuPI-related putative proteinase inhibitor [Candidatus Eisenbacteria bacterium]
MNIVLCLRLRVLSKISLGLVLVMPFFFSTMGASQAVPPAGDPKGKTQAEPKGVTLKLPEAPKPKIPAGTLPYQMRSSGNLSVGMRKLRSYAQREQITFEMVVKNVGTKKASLLFPSAKEFDFVATDGKSVIWRWGSDKMFAQVRRMRSLAPQDSLHFEVTWDQLKNNGTYCDLGNYKVRGILETAKPDSTPWVQLGIVD